MTFTSPTSVRRRLLPFVAVVLTASALAGFGSQASGSSAPAPSARPAAVAAIARDAPDPDIVRVGSTYYAFTTGTSWGNYVGVAENRSGNPAKGWRLLGSAFRWNHDTAPPASWQRNNSQTSPAVIRLGGRWVMYYDAIERSTGYFCLSVATASVITGPYVDSTHGPLMCQRPIGGAIDPHPFVDPRTHVPYLMWKNNAGLNGSHAASSVWSSRLRSDGRAFTSRAHPIFTIKSHTYRWQTTTDDPSMFYARGHYYLFFSGGDWKSNYYPVGYVVCSGPLGGCDQTEAHDPFLSGGGGTGGGMEFTDTAGRVWIAYQSWRPSGCTSYARRTCMRQMFVTPLSLPR